MSRYEATFEIKSKTDAYAVQLLIERAYDSFREELQDSNESGASLNETLETLQAIREAARHPSSGALTVVYEEHDEPFDD